MMIPPFHDFGIIPVFKMILKACMTGLHKNGIADLSISFLIKSYELALLIFSF